MSNASDTSLETLRELLLTPEQKELEVRLKKLEERLRDKEQRIEDVSEVVPEAMQHRQQRDDSLGELIAPVVKEAVQKSVRGDPNEMAEALFPIVGPVVRKAIAAALSGSSGEKPDYKLEQLFLIHKETGLLVLHEVAPDVVGQDASLVAGMLTAIQDFVHDAFEAKAFDGLNTLRVGDLNVWIEWGPQVVAAVALRGSPPETLRQGLLQMLETLHQTHEVPLQTFTGDMTPFKNLEGVVENFLEAEQAPEPPRKIPWLKYGLLALLVGLLVFGSLWWRDGRRWRAFLEGLDNAPGLVVTEHERSWFNFYLRGLRDPLAAKPETLLAQSSLNSQRVRMHWETYYALEPAFVLQRAKEKLRPPLGVTLTFSDGELTFSGRLSATWLAEAQRLALVLPGVEKVSTEGEP
jgi:uncharacterized coiled-coil protein SlyX